MAHAKVCMIPRCPEQSEVRIRDLNNKRRVDVCLSHALVTIHHYGKNVEIADIWNDQLTTDSIMHGVQIVREKQNERAAAAD
jgi:hypothetical protein